MANLYRRNLLTNFEVTDIEKVINEAMRYLCNEAVIPDQHLKLALLNRLELRRTLMIAVQLDGIVDPERAIYWEQCLDLLPALMKSHKLSIPVEGSFNIKIQRRLASSVPPRPIVNISFDEAFAFFSRLCQNAKDAYRMLEYHGSSHLLVRNFMPSRPDRKADLGAP